MHPAFSVIFFTTIAGAGQGLMLAMAYGEVYNLAIGQMAGHDFYLIGAVIALVLTGMGLVASMFHLGHPTRGWRAFSQWRTSWLSREVIALPFFMFTLTLYGYSHFAGMSQAATLGFALLAVVAAFILFVCTGMIYACLKFLREWATPYTLINFILFGSASGFALAAAYASFQAPHMSKQYAIVAVVLTIISLITRSMSLARNANLKPQSTTQTAIGIHHPNVKQRSMGQMGGSYNTKEFFHGKTAAFLKNIKTIFMLLVFPIPLVLLLLGMNSENNLLLILAVLVQYIGLVAERWFFFAQVNHPQNLYYQTVS